MSEEQKLKQCSTCAYGVSNLEEPRAPWVNFDLGDGFTGWCFVDPPTVEDGRPSVCFSDFCSRWTDRD